MHVFPNGSPVPEGTRVKADHSVQTFTVTIKAMAMPSASTVKALVQSRYEVTQIEAGETLVVCTKV